MDGGGTANELTSVSYLHHRSRRCDRRSPFGDRLAGGALDSRQSIMETRRVRLLVRSGPGIDQSPLPVALADSKHPLGRTAFGTPRTGDAPISCQVLSWSSGVKTAGSTLMSHSNLRACSYQAARFDECEPQPWVGESPESQPAKGDSTGVSQTHGQGVSREGDVDRPRGRCSASICG